MSRSLSFYVVNAFASDPFRGNPAAIVFLDDLHDADLLQKIAINFNQPMTAFLRAVPTDDPEPQSITFDVRWFNSGGEIPLCGHATIASSGLMFFSPGLISPSVETISYRTAGGLLLTARKAGDWVDLSLTAAEIQPLAPHEVEKLSDIIARSVGKPVSVQYAAAGLGPFSEYLLAEIDVGNDLAGCEIQHDILVSCNRCPSYQLHRNPRS